MGNERSSSEGGGRGGFARTAAARKPLLLILALIAGVLLIVVARQRWGSGSLRYVLVFDAGSSGTRVFAYTWEPPLSPGALPVVHAIPPSAAASKVPRRTQGKSLYERVETQPGLQAFVGDAAALHSAVEPLLDWARAAVPRASHAATPAFLLATGGVRRLPVAQREALLQEAGRVLAGSGFLFQAPARAISGSEEAVYGWVALNYQRGTLAGAPTAAAAAAAGRRAAAGAQRRARRGPTVGALDLGGATLEVAYEVTEGEEIESSNTTVAAGTTQQVALAGVEYRIRTAAFAGVGLNEAFDRGVSLLIEDTQGPAAAPASPHKQQQQQQQQQQQASPPGVHVPAGEALAAATGLRHRRQALLGGPPASGPAAAADSTGAPSSSTLPTIRHPCLHKGYGGAYNRSATAAAPPKPEAVWLSAAFDWDACVSLAQRVVNASAVHSSALQPRLAGPYIAMSGFYIISKFLGVPADAPPAALLPAAHTLCALPWSRVVSDRGGAVNLERYCGWGPFAAELLQTGLGLGGGSGSSKGVNVSSVAFGKGDLGWPLGAALVEASRLPGFAPQQQQQGVIGSPTPPWDHYRPQLSTSVVLAAAAFVAVAAALAGRRLLLRPKGGRSPLRPGRTLSATSLPLYGKPRVGGLAARAL